MRLPLPLDSYRRSSPERLVNCYPEVKPKDAKSPVALVRAPGITSVLDAGAPGRGLAYFAGFLWAVVSGRLYRINVDTASVTAAGPILGADRVSLASTVDRLCVVSRGAGYLATAAGVVTQIGDVDFRESTAVDFLDNYLLFVEAQSGRFFSSNLNAPESYDSLFFATAESNPDNLVGIVADHGQAFLAGERSCELWQNVGGAGFPFSRVSNGTLEVGCAAGQSLAKLDNTIFWLDDRLIVRRLSGVTPVRVSHHGVEDALQGYGDVSRAYGLAYTFDGHLHYALTVPEQGTWVFDVTTGRWHERVSFDGPHWRVIAVAQIGTQVWALHEDGRLGIMQAGRYTEFGDPQIMSWTHQPIYSENKRLSIAEIELVARTQP
jgi:hypothetical protein